MTAITIDLLFTLLAIGFVSVSAVLAVAILPWKDDELDGTLEALTALGKSFKPALVQVRSAFTPPVSAIENS